MRKGTMSSHVTMTRWVPAVVLAAMVGCNGHAEVEEQAGVSVVEIGMPEEFGALRRPPVIFDHEKHTSALKDERCDRCHPANRHDELVFKFQRTEDGTDRDALMSLYHDECGRCHEERVDEDTPVACAQCHVARAPAGAARAVIRFDYSLHGRHAIAHEEDGKCEACHHVVNKETKELEYRKGEESACRDCHGKRADGDTPSLADASHQDCVGCHLERDGKGQKAGPQHCDGCHDAEKLESIERLDEIPRIERNQPKMAWIRADGGKAALVAFDHKAHEPHGEFCATCHHKTLKSCNECHTLAGNERGEGVTVHRAHHDAESRYSCVGCHQQETATEDCAGCHHRIRQIPRERTCATCHAGPHPGDDAANRPPKAAMPVELAPLPAVSEVDFPQTVVIDTSAGDYEASKFPHAKVVARLHRAIEKSELARRFHMKTELLCTGCHHQTAMGERPPPCSSCHSKASAATEDMPGLRAAYHRQCLECHKQMGIEKQGCTDCHKEASAGGDR
jgi:hypothetical protein